MRRLRLLTLASLAALSSCTQPDAALKVTVTVRAAGTNKVRADCIKLTVSNETQELKSIVIKRPADDDAVFAVRKGADLPGSVRLQASGYLGTCTDESTLKLNAQGEVVTGLFPESGVSEVAVFLDPPSSVLDADRDGFVAAGKGGIDCRDDDSKIFPGAGQVCSNTADTDCDGLGGCDDDECTAASVCVDPPSSVRITTSVASMLRYECRGPFLVELRNAAGPRVAIRDTPVALASSLSGVTVHGTATCNDAALSTQTVPYGGTSFEVYLKADGQAFGDTTLTATADRVTTPGTALVEVHPQPVDHIEFTSPARTVRAGECSTEQVTLEFRDSQNRHTDVDAPTTVTLSSAPGDINNANIFFSDSTCGTDGSMKMLTAGQGTIALYLKASRAGTFTLTATPSVQSPQTQMLTVQPGAPARLEFTNGPLVLNTTQSCSAGQLILQLQDQFQNQVNAASDLPVRVTVSGLSNVSIYDAAGNCATAASTDYVIPSGSNSIALRARGMTATPNTGDVRASVLNGANILDASQTIGISAGFASKFVLSGNAQSPLASVCSANPFTVELRDSADNPASASSNVTFTLSTVPASDASFHFYSGAGCQTDLGGMLTVPAGTTSTTFYYRGNKAITSFEIRASSSLTAPGTWLTGNSIRPGAPGKLVFVTPSGQTAQAGACTSNPYVANVLDLFDNPTSFTTAQTVNVSSVPTGVTVGSASACDMASSVSLPANTNQVSFNARHTVTTPTTPYNITATVSGFSTAPPATLNVTPGNSTLQVDTPLGGASSVTAGGCQQITLTRRDAFSNNAPTAGNTNVTLSFPPSTTYLVYASNNCSGAAGATPTMNSTHTTTFSVSPRTAGSGQAVTASIGSGPTLQTAAISFTVAPAAPTLVFETPATGTGSASATQTAGNCTQVTVARKDVYGNDVPVGGSGATLGFTLAGGTTAHTANTCLAGNATTGIALAATEARATFWVRATQSAAAPGGPATQNVVASLSSQTATLALTVNPGAPVFALLAPTGAATTVSANTCVPVSVERRDTLGNLVPVSAAMNLTVTPTTNLSIYGTTDCTLTASPNVPVTLGASQRSFSLKSSVAAPSLSLTVTLDGLTVPLSLTINPGPLAVLTVLGAPASMTTGGCIGPLTVRRRDGFANDITNGATSVSMSSSTFTFSAASDCSGAAQPLSVNIADGSAVSGNFYATATPSGSSTMTATVGAVTGTASVTVNPGTPILNVIVPTGGTTSVAANTCVPVTAERRDSNGNLVPLPSTMNLTVTPGTNLQVFSATDCSGSAITNVSVTSGASSRAFSIRSTLVGTYALTVTLDGQTAPLSLTVTPAATAVLLVQSLPASMTSGGCVGPLTIKRRDAYTNDTTAGTVSVTMTSSQFQFSSASDCSGAAASLPVGITDGVAVSGNFYATATASGTATMTATLAAITATGSLTVNAGPPAQLVFTTVSRTLTAGTCNGSGNVITVQLRDAAGNVTNALAGGQAFTAASTSGGGAWFTNNTCSTAAGGGAFTVPAGSSSVNLYYRDTVAGSITVTLTNGSSLTNPAGQAHTVNPGAATRLVFTTGARTFTAATCGGAANVITVQLQDANGNPVNASGGGQAFTAASNSTGTVNWYSDDTCSTAATGGSQNTFTIPAGSSSANVYYKDTKAGTPTITLGNGSGLTNPTGQVETVSVGAPSRLAFTSSVQTVAALACSALTTATLQDAGGNTVTTAADRVVTFSATPAGATTTFYSDPTCTTPLASDQVTMTTGTSTATMYFKAQNANAVTLTAATPGLTSGTQSATISAATPTQLVITTAPTTVEAGTCLAVVVERQDALNRTTSPTSATTITPAVSPTGMGFSFFSNAGCTSALGATFNILSGQPSATFYVKGTTGSLTGVVPGSQLYTVTLTAPSMTQDTLDVTVLPMVRRNSASCQLAGATSVTCPITPTLADITRTILFVQAVATTGDSPDDDNVTCKLDPNGGTAQVVCTRNGTGSGSNAVDISWQTLSFPTGAGVSVQHVSGGCTGAATNTVPMNVTVTSAALANSFVLFSSRTAGADNDAEHFFTARLTTATNLQVNQAAAGTTCARTVAFEAQVVTWTGSTVARGVTTGGSGGSFTASQATSGQTFLSYSSRQVATDLGTGNIGGRRLRGEITNGTTLTFARGNTPSGGDVQDIAWEVVRLPASAGTVQQVTGTTTNNGATVAISFSAAELTRSVLFMGGQGPGGSATGSSTYNAGDRIGSAQARAVPTSTTAANLTRSGNDAVGSFTAYVLTITP